MKPAFYCPRACRHALAPALSGNEYSLNIEAAHPIEIFRDRDLPLDEAKTAHLLRFRRFDSSYFNQGFSAPGYHERFPFGSLVDQLGFVVSLTYRFRNSERGVSKSRVPQLLKRVRESFNSKPVPKGD